MTKESDSSLVHSQVNRQKQWAERSSSLHVTVNVPLIPTSETMETAISDPSETKATSEMFPKNYKDNGPDGCFTFFKTSAEITNQPANIYHLTKTCVATKTSSMNPRFVSLHLKAALDPIDLATSHGSTTGIHPSQPLCINTWSWVHAQRSLTRVHQAQRCLPRMSPIILPIEIRNQNTCGSIHTLMLSRPTGPLSPLSVYLNLPQTLNSAISRVTFP